jgi:MFS family permease
MTAGSGEKVSSPPMGRDFRALWFGQSISSVGDQVSAFVLPTIAVLTLHASSVQIGALNAVATVAYPCLGLFAGVLMDRIRRRRAMVVIDAARLLIFGSLPVAAALGGLSLAHLFVVAALAGVCTVLFDVAYQSHLPSVLRGEGLARGNARLEMSGAVARFAGPPLGGLLLQGLGVVGALAANAISFLASIIGVLRIRTPETVPAVPAVRVGVRAQIAEGARFLWSHPLLRPLTVSAALRNFGMNAARAVFIVFIYRALHLSPGVAGVMFTSGALAAFVGAVFCQRLVTRLGAGRTLLLTAAEGLVWLLAPLTLLGGSVPILMALMFLSSLWLPIWNACVTTIRQAVTPAELLGRVHATARTINLSTIPVGAFAGGLLAQAFANAFGTRLGLALALSACAAVATASLTQLTRPEIRRLTTFPGTSDDRQQDEEEE